MAFCNHCDKQTNTVSIGTGEYCEVCGNRAELQNAPATSGRSIDLRAGKSSSTPTARTVRTTASAASVLHSRTTAATPGVLDLRAAKPLTKSGRVRNSRETAEAAPVPKQIHDPKSDHSLSAAIHQVAAPIHHQPVHSVTGVTPRKLPRFEDRFERAKGTPKSAKVSKFGIIEPETQIVHHSVVSPPHQELSSQAATHHQALSRLVASLDPTTGEQIHHTAPPKASRYAATAAAVLIMGGYIWLQNYPKLAIQAAGSKAGLTASLPGYLPSSYNLNGTNASPGLVTLSFASPSQPQPLTIAQHSTSWDSNSLLDNYVTKQSSDYTAVEGQGLTIFLFHQNEASWVNHGVWYSITGAARLSREQILKIAYSL